MRKPSRAFFLYGAVFFMLCGLPRPALANSGSELFYDLCLSCHMIDMFEHDDRSTKGWGLTVYRMQQYASFSDEEADQIIEYLSNGDMQKEYFAPDPGELFTAQRLRLLDRSTSATLMNMALAQGGTFIHGYQPSLFLRVRNPQQGTLMFAKLMGYVAVACLVLLILTGLRRKALGKRFRPAHRILTVLLGVAVFFHVFIDVLEYGAPPILWLWFGVVSFLAIMAAHLTGYLRMSTSVTFKAVHFSLGGLAFGFAILHWMWAWL